MCQRPKKHIILASSSPYRRQLLTRLIAKFDHFAPDIDESAQPNETAEKLVRRLATDKAMSGVDKYPNSVIIGSDEVAELDNEILTKPITHHKAVYQLTKCSGQTVTFFTGLSVVDSSTNIIHTIVEPYTVTYRPLNKKLIEHYLHCEQPYNCAGSLKSEGLGIALLAAMHGADPTSLMGLPLIKLIDILQQFNVDFTEI